MTKHEMIKAVASASGTTHKQVDSVLDAYAEVVLAAIKNDVNDKIVLPGLGTFKGKEVGDKTGTVLFGSTKGNTWTKPAHNELRFTITKSAKEV